MFANFILEPHPHLRAQISISPKSRPHSDSIANRIDVRPTTVTYIDNIVRAPPLPPIDELLPENEVMTALYMYSTQ